MGGKQEIHSLSDETAEITLTHPAGGSARIQWTIEMAKKAGLAGKDNWKSHPRSMLLRRAQAEAVRAVAPFILEGLPTEDEAVEIEETHPLTKVKPDINVDKLPSLTEPVIEMTDIMLDRDWDRDSKARATREAKRLGGSVSKEGIASIPTSKAAEFDDFIGEIALKHFQALVDAE